MRWLCRPKQTLALKKPSARLLAELFMLPDTLSVQRSEEGHGTPADVSRAGAAAGLSRADTASAML